ncbi:MAG TPA: IPT/TIG domain-containing protein [Polyangia bacterium]|nr:IPT/TIG domain-containing protein [Polyangia bacterium]
MGTPGRARLGVALLALASSGGGASCTGAAEPQLTLSGVTPAAAFNDTELDLVVHGTAFRPTYELDTSAGQETAQLGAFTMLLTPSEGTGTAYPADQSMWISPTELAASIPKDVTAGTYDVEVRDPRGAFALLTKAFVSLGRDTMSPSLKIVEPAPGAIVNPGAEVPLAYEVDDGAGFVDSTTWTVSTGDFHHSEACPVAPKTHRMTCRFVFTVPATAQSGQPLSVVVTATDTAKNPPTRAEAQLAVGLPPVVTSFNPGEGSALGGTLLSVRGHNFIKGTQVLVGGALLEPDGGLFMNEGLIQGSTPAHDPGRVSLTVRTGPAALDVPNAFVFVGRPRVRAIAPSGGAAGGCTRVAIAGENFREMQRVWVGSDESTEQPLQCRVTVSPNRIEGYVPPGSGVVSVFVGDSVSGVGELSNAFTYLYTDNADASTSTFLAACPCDGGAP